MTTLGATLALGLLALASHESSDLLDDATPQQIGLDPSGRCLSNNANTQYYARVSGRTNVPLTSSTVSLWFNTGDSSGANSGGHSDALFSFVPNNNNNSENDSNYTYSKEDREIFVHLGRVNV